MEQNTSCTNPTYHGDNKTHQRIQSLINESADPEFTRFLNQLGNALWQGNIDDMSACNELDRAYSVYIQNMQHKQQIPPGYIYPGQVEYITEPAIPHKRNIEFTVGAGVLGVTGAIFLLIAFVIFAMNFMSDLIKCISLYVIAMTVILVSEIIMRKRNDKLAKRMTGVGIIVLCIGGVINIVTSPLRMLEYPNWIYSLLPFAIITIVLTILIKHPKCRWIPYWFFNGIVLSSVYENALDEAYSWTGFICMLMLFLWSKICSKAKVLHVSECIITIITVLYMLGINVGNCGTENISMVMLLIVTICFIISVLAVNYWHAFYGVIITVATIICAFKLIPETVRLPIITGILILSIFLFSLLFKEKTEHSIKAYNLIVLCMIAACYFNVISIDNIYIYLAMILFGVTLFAIFFEDKYKLQTRHKGLWIGCFLTYMFLILDTEYPIINSVLLATTAILCVTMGFISRTKPVRVYGIIMAIVVAIKIAVFDLMGMGTIHRVLTFLIVGILTLVISYIYVLLEKKIAQDDN